MLRNAIIRGEIKLKFDKIVAIVRDPRDEFISRFYYLIYLFLIRNDVDMTKVKEWLSIIEEKERNPKSLSFMTMVDKMNSLLGMNLKWPQSGKSDGYVNFLNNNSKWLHIIKYEDFIDNKVQQLEKYLGFNLSSERDIGDLSRTKRSAKYNNWKKIFTADDVRHMQNAFSFEMKAWGYADWELEDCLQLDPNDGSLYLNKLIEEALAKKISLARQPAQFRRN